MDFITVIGFFSTCGPLLWFLSNFSVSVCARTDRCPRKGRKIKFKYSSSSRWCIYLYFKVSLCFKKKLWRNIWVICYVCVTSYSVSLLAGCKAEIQLLPDSCFNRNSDLCNRHRWRRLKIVVKKAQSMTVMLIHECNM